MPLNFAWTERGFVRQRKRSLTQTRAAAAHRWLRSQMIFPCVSACKFWMLIDTLHMVGRR